MQVRNIDMWTNSGTFSLSYQMYSIPDQLTVAYEGATLFTTDGLVSGSRTV